MQALGVRFLDSTGQELAPGGAALAQLDRIDTAEVNPLVAQCRFEVASDVDNPLYGQTGASVTFGPQKGATPADVRDLDHALEHFAAIARNSHLGDFASTNGAGAAGGMGFGALTFLNVEMKRGIEVVMEAVDLASALEGADLLITGEGRIDRQTLSGKTPFGAMQAALAAGVPTVAIVGCIGPGSEEVIQAGMTAIFGIVPSPMDLTSALDGSRANLRHTARSVAALWSLGQPGRI